MNFKSQDFHDRKSSLTQSSLMSGGRFVYFASGGEGGASADAKDPAMLAEEEKKRRLREEKEALTEEQIEGEKNEEYARKIDQLAARDAISREIADSAKDALKSNKKEYKKLGQMLANRDIDGKTFAAAYEAIQGKGSNQKLGGRLARGEITGSTFNVALEDLKKNNAYDTPLARRLALEQIDSEEYERAREALRSNDPDEKHVAQMFARALMESNDFRNRMEMAARKVQKAETRAEADQDQVATTQKEIHDRITELLISVNVVMEQLPEQERTRPLKKLRRNLENLNNRDNTNRSAMAAYLRTLNEKGELRPEDAKWIMDFDAHSKEELDKFKTALYATELSASAVKHVMKLKKEEWYIEKDFLQQVKITQDIMKSAWGMVQYETAKERMIEEASSQAGVRIKEGTLLQYVHPDPTTDNLRTRKIKKLEFVDAPIVDGIGEDANVIGKQPKDIYIYLDNGEKYTLGRFMKWINAADVHEQIDNQNELEQSLGLHQVGMHFKDGQAVDYTKGYRRDSSGNLIPKRAQAEIYSIDDQKVVFKKAIQTYQPGTRGPQDVDSRLEVPRITREMNLGEFSKWARRTEALPQIKSLDELREHLKNHSNYINQTWQRSAGDYPPITLERDEILQFGDDEKAQFQIKKADDEKIEFKNGTEMTLPQFLGWVRSNYVERANPKDVADREMNAAERLGEEIDEEARTGFLAKAMEKMKKKAQAPPSSGDDKSGPQKSGPQSAEAAKSFFEKISPYIPTKERPYGLLQETFQQYTYLSFMDLWNMGKEILEFIKRKHQRRSKKRYGFVGSRLPSYLGTEMKRVHQAGENEEVNQYKESFEQMGTWEVLEKLHNTNSSDEAKACFITLTEKGELRWDDKKMWDTLNRLTAAMPGVDGANLYIQLTDKLQPSPGDPDNPMSGEDKTKYSMDALWGEGQWADWYSKNTNSYNSKKSAYEYKGKQLEHDPKGTGGLAGEMTRLLKDWKKGKYVNPQEYEELIDFAIKYGKMSAEEKMYFLIEGVMTKCPSGAMAGMTLLHLDRIGDLDGQYLNQFPMLDFFTNKLPKPLHPKYLNGQLKEPPKGGYKVEDYEYFRDNYFSKEDEVCAPGKNFSRFLWENMIIDPYFRLRLSKGLRRADNMDHDDAHMFIPPAGLEEIGNLTGSYQGQQKFFTPEGYKNGYGGYSQFIVSLSNRQEELLAKQKAGMPVTEVMLKENLSQMLAAIQGYILYDSYMDGRNDQRNRSRARLDSVHYQESAVVDLKHGFKVGQHKSQLDNLAKTICDAYDIDWKKLQIFDVKAQYNETQLQSEIAGNIDNLLKFVLPKAMEKDGGAAMFKIISKRKMAARTNEADENALRGIRGSNRILEKDFRGFEWDRASTTAIQPAGRKKAA